MKFDVVQFTLALSTLLTSIGALIYAIRGDVNSRRNTVQGAQNAARIEEVHQATNGMKTELVNEVRAASFAKGEAKGAADEKAQHL